VDDFLFQILIAVVALVALARVNRLATRVKKLEEEVHRVRSRTEAPLGTGDIAQSSRELLG